ncbi:GTPase IMAP family member 4-like [Alosa sapidissima]|uniref:GTPase IMAP family member 4-like n=1 Tax=Alosa sapidissima TaxID=34773 RepID=UPI001C0A56EC|nr:GTPase IMAP family member 4-like [Alosa sapidissima]
MRMFGEQVWRHTIVLFTSGDLLGDTSIEEHIESEGEPLRWVIEKCGNRYHVLGKDQSRESLQVAELLEKIEEMVAGNSLFILHPETQTPEVEEMSFEPDETNADMVRFLDKEWSKMDKEMEDTMTKMYSQNVAQKGKESMDGRTDFHNNKQPSDTSEEEKLSTECSGPLTTYQSTSESEGKARQAKKEVPQKRRRHESHEDPLEKMRETLQREWGRREVTVTERFQGILSESLVLSSEADEHERELCRRKVQTWLSSTCTSGYDTEEDVIVENEHR